MSLPVRRRARVAILGLGHVGSAVAARLADGRVPGLELTHVFDRRADQKRLRFEKRHVPAIEDGRGRTPGSVEPPRWSRDIESVLSGDAELIVETLGGVEPAAGWIRAALARGKSVVTANKQVVARHGRELLALASRQGRQFRFEAAVGGAMPIVTAIREALAGDRIQRIEAVLNGTCTFVLSRLERAGGTLADAVRDAQARGLAEADPTADIEGHDAAAKLAILCGVAFGAEVSPEQIAKRSIAPIDAGQIAEARRRGLAIRQVASATYDASTRTLTAFVGPHDVPASSFLGRVEGAGNAAVIHCERAGAIGLFGRGAGGEATAVAIVSDLLAIARDPAAIVPPPQWSRPSVIAGPVPVLAEAV